MTGSYSGWNERERVAWGDLDRATRNQLRWLYRACRKTYGLPRHFARRVTERAFDAAISAHSAGYLEGREVMVESSLNGVRR